MREGVGVQWRGGEGEKRLEQTARADSTESPDASQVTPAPLLPKKHLPERTCAACRTKKPQSDLYRIRKTPQGWTMDSSVTVGRSAYLCSSPYCHVEKRLKRTFGAQAAQIAAQLFTRPSET